MRTPTSVRSVSTLRMLTNVWSCLNQNPDWNCWATMRVVVAQRLRADLLREALGLRRDELAGEKRDDRERDADAHQRPADLQQRRAGRAHHRVLRVRDELRQREQRADQRRDGKELVHPRRQLQRDEQQRGRSV